MLIDFRKVGAAIKKKGSETTAVISDFLKAYSPQWAQADKTYKGYTPGKKQIAIVLLAFGAVAVWHWSIDVGQVFGRGVSYARELVKGNSVSHAELSAEIAKLPKAADIVRHQQELDSLKAEVDEVKATVSSLDDRLDNKNITTGSLPPKKANKKTPPKKPSSSVPNLSKWLP